MGEPWLGGHSLKVLFAVICYWLHVSFQLISNGGLAIDTQTELAELIRREHEPLLSDWRDRVRKLPSARHLDTPTLNDHIPMLLVELAAALLADQSDVAAREVRNGSSPAHGRQRLREGYDIGEVVAEYGILRSCIHEYADEKGMNLRGEPLRVFNRVLDEAIRSAVETFASQRALEVQKRREEYLAFVAHDLRTPLNAIALSARVLEMSLGKQTAEVPTGKMLKSLQRNVQHLGGLVAKIIEENSNLKTEAGIKLERRHFDLWPLVESLIHDIHPVADTVSTVLINEVPEDLVVFADASLLKRILQNLIANAIKYTPRGDVFISAKPNADSIECAIRDNGTGIAQDRLAIVFEPFETDSRQDGGMGLGLAIVKTFVEAHHGIVEVQSELGVGSTFRFTLPQN